MPGGTAGSLPGQVPLNELLNDGGDGDSLAPVLGDSQGVGALTGVDAAGKVCQRVTGRLAGFREASEPDTGRTPRERGAVCPAAAA